MKSWSSTIQINRPAKRYYYFRLCEQVPALETLEEIWMCYHWNERCWEVQLLFYLRCTRLLLLVVSLSMKFYYVVLLCSHNSDILCSHKISSAGQYIIVIQYKVLLTFMSVNESWISRQIYVRAFINWLYAAQVCSYFHDFRRNPIKFRFTWNLLGSTLLLFCTRWFWLSWLWMNDILKCLAVQQYVLLMFYKVVLTFSVFKWNPQVFPLI